MIIQKIELFSTPLTPDYRNVYDDYNSSTDYVNFLKENFLYEVFNRPTDSSRKEKNGELDIVLHGLHTDAVRLHDYNYVAIYTTHGGQDDIIKFAFVIDMESVNDTAEVGQNGSIKIHVKMDSWANHYLNIKYAYNSIVENRCTFDTAAWRNYPSKLKEHLYSESIDFDTFFPAANNQSLIVHPVVPLWNRIYLTGNGKLHGGTANGIVIEKDKYYDNHPTVYEFCGLLIFDPVKGFIPLYTAVGFRYFDSSLNAWQYNELSTLTVKSVKSSFAASSTLTCNVPFAYTIKTNENTSTPYVEIDSNFTLVRGNKVTNEANSIEVVSTDEGRILFYQTSFGDNTQTIMIEPSPLALSFGDVSRYDTDFKSNYEQIYHEYPFNYKSFNYGKISIPIVGALGTNRKLSVNYSSRTRTIPFVTFTDINDKTIEFPLTNNQELPISSDMLDEYLARNSGNITNQIVQTLLSSIMSFKSGVANVAIGVATENLAAVAQGASQIDSIPLKAIGNAASIGLTCFDAYRTPAVVRDTDTNAASTWLPSDTACIKNHSAYNVSNYIKDYHYNGYECYYTGKISEKRRDVFDVDCGFADIACPMSKDDKEELISAFSRGVTRWHIGENNADRKAVLSAMNKNVVNYPISLIQ